GDKYAEILLQRSAKPHQSRAVFGGNRDTLRTHPNRYAQRRAAQTGISWDQSECQAARNCRWGCYRLRFQRDPAYLAEKTGKFLPARTEKARAELLSWMFFVSSGVGPYFGQSVHFRNYAPEKISYAINRYAFEAQRHAGILNTRLGKQ